MSKPLAGKRAFEAMGRRAEARGFPLDFVLATRKGWPRWAAMAYLEGWTNNKPFAVSPRRETRI